MKKTRIPHHPHIVAVFGARNVCRCGRCISWRRRAHLADQSQHIWGPGWGQQLRDNAPVLDMLANINNQGENIA